MNLNKVILVGRVTANPELRRTPGGSSVSTFSVATNRVWTDKVKGKQEETEFHTIVAWGRTAEIASQYLQKGAMVMIEGRLRTRSWQDKQSVTHKATEIICETLQLGPRAANSGPNQSGPSGTGGVNGGSWSSRPASAQAPAGKQSDAEAPQSAAEEIPIINLDDEPMQMSDDIPF